MCLVKLQKKTISLDGSQACVPVKITIHKWFSSDICSLLLLDIYKCPYFSNMILYDKCLHPRPSECYITVNVILCMYSFFYCIVQGYLELN